MAVGVVRMGGGVHLYCNFIACKISKLCKMPLTMLLLVRDGV